MKARRWELDRLGGNGLLWDEFLGQGHVCLIHKGGKSIVHAGLMGDSNPWHVYSVLPAGDGDCSLPAPSVPLFEASIPEGPSPGPTSPAVLFLALNPKAFSVST